MFERFNIGKFLEFIPLDIRFLLRIINYNYIV